ncbi:MAG: HAMP domain-containing sensor histidine kinase [Actinomycetota bacterium]
MAVGGAIGVPLTALLAAPDHRGVSQLMAIAAFVVGLVCWRAPWDKLPERATLVIPVYALIALSVGIHNGRESEAFAAFFVVIFAWLGIAHARWTCLLLAPLGVAAYVVPTLARGDGWDEAALGLYYVPIAVITGEAIGWLADRLRSSEKGLRRSDQLRNEFIGMVAHDMRTAITVISGFTQTLRLHPDEVSDLQRADFLATIDRNAKRASEFVENLLQFARIEANEFRQVIEPFDMGALVRRVVKDAEGPDHRGRFVLRIAFGLPPAIGDENRNAQVLGNLLSNALKFSPAARPIVVDVEQVDGDVCVSVTDRGPGVRSDELPQLFHKFATFDVRDGKKRPAGTGLGLYISRKLVEAQGGRIWVEQVDGGGARFAFTVPVAALEVPSDLSRLDEVVVPAVNGASRNGVFDHGASKGERAWRSQR